MGSKCYRHSSFPCVISATVIVTLFFLTQSSEARYRGINPWCRTADHRLLCTHMVRGATNWHDASANCMRSALGLAERLQSMIDAISSSVPDLPPPTRDSILDTCKTSFDDSVDNLRQAIQFLESGDVGGMNSFLSAVFSVSDCGDVFQQFGGNFPQPLEHITSLLYREVSNCLAVTQQI